MSKGVILVDFDGTIVEHRFPAIGEPLPNAFEVLIELKNSGYKLVLWTCREDYGHLISKQYLTAAVKFCAENGVEFDAVNETMEEHEFRPEDCLKRKPHAHFHIDDRNLGGFSGWLWVKELLLKE
jgi:predicted mannosyl-3-phosphoglycerate phosphatase (HAD superfamily)